MALTTLITTDVLIDRPRLSMALVPATGSVMARRFGSEPRQWEKSYRHVLEDWDNYWADLNLAEDSSLRQWREGRWRIERALFRLTRVRPPSIESISLHLDKLPREIGRECQAWRSGAVEGLKALAGRGARIVLLAPTQPAALIWGLAENAKLDKTITDVLGPDELGQVGLEGIPWQQLVWRAGGEMGQTWLVGESGDLPTIAPPEDLSTLADVVFTDKG